MTIPEPARAWVLHTARVLAVLAALALATAFGALLLLTTAYALVGAASWWQPVGLLAVVVLAAGTASWWRAGKVRPGTIPASAVLRGHLHADIRRDQP